jgi:Protein of unknown function (DUF3592)
MRGQRGRTRLNTNPKRTLAFGGVLLGLVAVFFGVLTWRQYSTREWPSIQGTVSYVSKGGVRSGHWVEYTYTVDGRPLKSTQMDYMFGGPLPRPPKVGDPITVYYDPAAPGSSVLTTDLSAGGILIVAGMLAAAALLLLFGLRRQ